MSIPALNNTTDYDVYTKKYLQSLNLQVELNKKNFDANYAFQKTGVQETERPDMRPIEERMADVEKLKVQARMMLNKVTDANNTNQIMEYLLKNSNILFFFIQNFPSLEAIVKQQFSGGILASQMISLIYKSYLKYTDEALIPNSEDYQLVSSLASQEDIRNLIDSVYDDNLKQTLKDNLSLFIPKNELDELINNPEKYVTQIHELADQNKDALTYNDINPLIEAYNDRKVFKTDANEQTIFQTENRLFQKIRDLVDAGKLQSFILTPVKLKKDKGLVLKPTKKEQIKQISPQVDIRPGKTTLKKTGLTTEEGVPIEKESKILKKEKEIIKKEKEKKQKILEELTKQKESLKKPKTRYGKPIIKKLQEQELEIEQPKTEKPQSIFEEETPEFPQFGSGIMDAREKHIHRFKVLKGEILAGNTNSAIIKELKSLVVKMIKYNELEPPQALMILKELNNIK